MRRNLSAAYPLGLQELYKAAVRVATDEEDPIDEGNVERTVLLFEHPFGYAFPAGVDHLTFLGYPGQTEESVNAFTEWVVRETAHVTRFEVHALRRIDACGSVYFEAAINGVSFMCGGCSADSGEGSRGRERLEGVLHVLSTLSGCPIQECEAYAEQGMALDRHVRTQLET